MQGTAFWSEWNTARRILAWGGCTSEAKTIVRNQTLLKPVPHHIDTDVSLNSRGDLGLYPCLAYRSSVRKHWKSCEWHASLQYPSTTTPYVAWSTFYLPGRTGHPVSCQPSPHQANHPLSQSLTPYVVHKYIPYRKTIGPCPQIQSLFQTRCAIFPVPWIGRVSRPSPHPEQCPANEWVGLHLGTCPGWSRDFVLQGHGHVGARAAGGGVSGLGYLRRLARDSDH